jgi:two-component system, LytTR family, response regulator
MSIRVAIIEDEAPALDLITDYVEKLTDWQIVHTSMSAESALPILTLRKADLVFCDINLPGINGLELQQEINFSTPIVYTTSYLQYVYEAFRGNAIDYLLKPVSEDRFQLAVQRCLNVREEVWYPPSPYLTPYHVEFTTDEGTFACSAERILFIESYGGLSKVTFIDTHEITLVKQDITSILRTLGSEHFVRTHRLFLVSKYFIKSVEEKFILVGNYKIPLAAQYLEGITESLS